MENNLKNLVENEQEKYEENEQENLLKARAANRKIILSYFIFFISTILFSLLTETGVILDSGIKHIIIIGLSMIPIYFFIGKKSLETLKEVKQKHFEISDWFFFIGLSYLMSYIFGALTRFLVTTFNIPSPDVTGMIQNSLSITMFIYVVIFGPIMEEIQFRGFYLNNVRKYGRISSIILVSLLFSFSHLNIIQGLGTLGFGLIFTYVAYCYSIREAIILHMINNLIVSLIGLVDLMGIMIISISVIILAVTSFGLLFTEKRRNEFKNNLKIDSMEKKYLKNLFTDFVFIIYLIIIIAVSVYVGFLSNNM